MLPPRRGAEITTAADRGDEHGSSPGQGRAGLAQQNIYFDRPRALDPMGTRCRRPLPSTQPAPHRLLLWCVTGHLLGQLVRKILSIKSYQSIKAHNLLPSS